MNGDTARYNRWIPVTTSDTVNFDGSVSATGGNVLTSDAVYVGGAGVVVAVAQNGSLASFTTVAGQLLPIAAIRVNATNTTATLLVALLQQ